MANVGILMPTLTLDGGLMFVEELSGHVQVVLFPTTCRSNRAGLQGFSEFEVCTKAVRQPPCIERTWQDHKEQIL
jgi:hypothetical protein